MFRVVAWLRSTTVRVPACWRRGGEVVTERREGRSARLTFFFIIIISLFAPRFVLFVGRKKEKKATRLVKRRGEATS